MSGTEQDIKQTARGEVIRASLLSQMARQINANRRKIQQLQESEPIDDGQDESPSSGTWRAVTATFSTVRIEDASDPTVYVDISRIDTLQMRQDGTGAVENYDFTGIPWP